MERDRGVGWNCSNCWIVDIRWTAVEAGTGNQKCRAPNDSGHRIIELQNATNEHADTLVRGLSGQELSETDSVIFDNLIFTKSSFHQQQTAAVHLLGTDYGEQVQVREMPLFFI
jgi:hypothetical protein